MSAVSSTFRPFSPLERAVLDAARLHQQGSTSRSELLMFVGDDGKSVIDAGVAPSGMHLPDLVQARLASRGRVRVLHNHPSEGPLSQSDWRTCSTYPDILEIAAITSDGSTFIGRAKEGPRLANLHNAVCSAYDHLFSTVFLHLQDDWLSMHLIAQRLVELGVVDYEVALSPSRVAQWYAANMATAQAFLNQAIV